MLYTHFSIGGSYALLKRVISAWKFVLKRRCPIRAKFPEDSDVVKYRKRLSVPDIQIFKNPNGNKVGRICSLKELHKHVFFNRKIVKHMDFYLGNRTHPLALSLNHTDGSTQTSSIGLLDSHQRFPNLKKISRNPASLLPVLLEQDKETTGAIQQLFAQSISEAAAELAANGQDVICPIASDDPHRDMSQDDVMQLCQLCGNFCPRKDKKQNDLEGKPSFFHNIPGSMWYSWDIKCSDKKVSKKTGYCLKCDCAIRVESYKDLVNEATAKPVFTTLEDYINADKIYTKHMEAYRQSIPSYERPCSIFGIHNQCFQESAFYPQFEAEMRKTFGKSFEKFEGWTSDQATPLFHHVTDTLHAQMKFGNIAMDLAKLGAQRVELRHPGLGLHALQTALRFCGLGSCSTAVKEEATKQYGNKLETFISAGTHPCSVVTTEKALADEFRKWIEGGAVPRSRLEELHKHFDSSSHNIKKKVKTSAKEITAQILAILRDTPNTSVLKAMSSKEHEKFSRKISHLKVNKLNISNDKKVATAELKQFFDAANLKLKGGDAAILLAGGGAETMFHHLDVLCVNFKLKNREAIDAKLQHLHRIETQCIEAERSLQKLMGRIAEFQEIQPGSAESKMEVSETEFGAELTSMFEDVAKYTDEAEQHRDSIVALAQDALQLYRGTGNFEVDSVMSKIMDVFLAFKELVLPIIRPASHNVDELINEMGGHAERVRKFVSKAKAANLNINLGDHSDYMHWLCAPEHADAECIYVLQRTGLHLSDLNAQTAESNHKILRAMLVRLQGFTNRAMGSTGGSDLKDEPVFNKMSFAMHEALVRVLHYFETLTPKQKPTVCGICNNEGHSL